MYYIMIMYYILHDDYKLYNYRVLEVEGAARTWLKGRSPPGSVSIGPFQMEVIIVY